MEFCPLVRTHSALLKYRAPEKRNSPSPKPYYRKLVPADSNAAKVSPRHIPPGPVLHRSIIIHNQLLRVTAFCNTQSDDCDPAAGNPLPPFLVWNSLDGDCRMACDHMEE